jgi:hypothetical protein
MLRVIPHELNISHSARGGRLLAEPARSACAQSCLARATAALPVATHVCVSDDGRIIAHAVALSRMRGVLRRLPVCRAAVQSSVALR